MPTIYRITISFIWLLLSFACVSCQQSPQRVKHLNKEQTVDSTLLQQMQFNIRMADEADRICQARTQQDSLTYVMDEFGFWYAKTINLHTDTLQKGHEIHLHLLINEINGPLILDTKMPVVVGAGDLPIAINRSLKMMSIGEQMSIITPWYTAYGIEGTSIIKPYSNLIILLTIEQWRQK